MFQLQLFQSLRFTRRNLDSVPRLPGVYIVYDFAGPLCAGRSSSDVHRALRDHYDAFTRGRGALALAIRDAEAVMFSYCVLPSSDVADVERLLAATLGLGRLLDLKRQGVFHDDAASPRE